MKKILTTLMLACCCLAIHAQPIVKPGSLYASVNGGAFAYSHSGTTVFGVPTFGVEVGSWLMKPLAFQIAYDGAIAPSAIEGSSDNPLFSFMSAEFKWDVNATFFNVYNKTFQYPIPFYPMIGLGMLIREPVTVNGKSTSIANKFQAMLGLQLPVRLTNHLSASLEYKCFLQPEDFDGTKGLSSMHLFTMGLMWRQSDDPFYRKAAFESRGTDEDWFVGVGIGPNYSSFDLFTNKHHGGLAMVGVAPEIMFGRNFSNFWTVRFEATGLTGHQVFDTVRQEAGDAFTFTMIHADLMMNLSHAFGFKRGVHWSIMPYLGAGTIWRYDNVRFDMAADFGIFFRRYISREGDLFVDLKYIMAAPGSIGGGNIPSGKFYGFGLPSLTVGYIHNFGHSTTRYRQTYNCAD